MSCLRNGCFFTLIWLATALDLNAANIFNASVGNCSFEKGLCAWRNVLHGDQFNWTILSGNTPSVNTGPSDDHTGGGNYLYIESSWPRTLGDKARILSPRMAGTQCMTFYYHMYGVTMGTLVVSLNATTKSANRTLWVKSGNQGDKWHMSQVLITDEVAYQVIISGIRGSKYQGDAAIDDISFTSGTCSSPAVSLQLYVYTESTLNSLLELSASPSPGFRAYEFSMYLPKMSKSSSEYLYLLCRGKVNQLFIERPYQCDDAVDFFFAFREKRPGLQPVFLVRGETVGLQLSLANVGTCCRGFEAEIIYVNISFAVNPLHGRPVIQSSQTDLHHAVYSVDGDHTTCARTRKEKNPRWQAHLETKSFVYKVLVSSNPNCCYDYRLPEITVEIGDSETKTIVQCKSTDSMARIPLRWFLCEPPVKASYIRISSNEHSQLVLCEVIVNTIGSLEDIKGVRHELWRSLPSRHFATFLNSKRFHDNPDVSTVIPRFYAPSNVNYYGQRLTAYLQPPVSGNFTLDINCFYQCRVWLSRLDDVEDVHGPLKENMLLDVDATNGREDRDSMSETVFMDRHRTYVVHALMKEFTGNVEVTIHPPRGVNDSLTHYTEFYWLIPGIRSVDFRLSTNDDPDYEMKAEVGQDIHIRATYKYCCQGIYCPACNVCLHLHALGRTFLVHSSLEMDCTTYRYSSTIKASTKPGNHYNIEISHVCTNDTSPEQRKTVGKIILRPAIILRCFLSDSSCQWKKYNDAGGKGWKVVVNKRQANVLSLRDSGPAWLLSNWIQSSSVYKITGLCLRFTYVLTSPDSVLKVFAQGSANQSSLEWSITGYHGLTWLEARVAWPVEIHTKVLIRASGGRDVNASITLANMSLVTDSCLTYPVYARPGHTCNGREFQCKNGICVNQKFVCDGDDACVDRSDEKSCECQSSQFKCPDGKCLSIRNLCNGIQDCGDNSDERNCDSQCPVNTFTCADGSCISLQNTCNDRNDCQDASDEPSICESTNCTLGNMLCSREKSSTSAAVCQILQGPCDFENGLCGLKNDPLVESEWQIGQGATPTEDTGPAYDHTTLSSAGKYIYLEASGLRQGDKVRLCTPWMSPWAHMCVHFWYHLYGRDAGSLRMFLETRVDQSLQEVWSSSGDHGNHWFYGQAAIDAVQTKEIRVVVEARVGQGNKGDIALDDFGILDKHCQLINKQENPSCYFQENFCGWENDGNWEAVNQLQFAGSVPERPGSDQRFAGIKITSNLKAARLTTSIIRSSDGWKCVKFWYYIHKTAQTSLAVYSEHTNGTGDLVWSSKFVTREWSYVRASLAGGGDIHVSFQGTFGTSQGLILLDDVSFSKEPCGLIFEDQCEKKTTAGVCCVFPFVYRKKCYSRCISHQHDRPWCATTNDYDQEPQSWGNCLEEDEITKTPPTVAPECTVKTIGGQCCVFPFIYNKKAFYKCIEHSHYRLWCATTADYDRDGHWGNCYVNETNDCSDRYRLFQWTSSGAEPKAIPWKDNVTTWPVSESKATYNKDTKTDSNSYEAVFGPKDAGYMAAAGMRSLTAVTVCLWAQSNDTSARGTPFLYRASVHESVIDVIGLLNQQSLTVVIMGEKRWTGISLSDGRWHHLCLVWESNDGTLELYKDGQIELAVRSINKGGPIPGDGIFYVAWAPIDFESSTSTRFVGKISSVNAWSRALVYQEIVQQGVGCGVVFGDVLSWSGLRAGVNGSVQFVVPPSCARAGAGHLTAQKGQTITEARTTKLLSRWFRESKRESQRCLKFRFLLHGPGTMSLRFHQILGSSINADKRLIWVQRHSSNDSLWSFAHVTYSTEARYQISIEGSFGTEAGVIGVAGLYFTSGYCSETSLPEQKACQQTLTDKSGHIVSPLHPGHYTNSLSCAWRISQPADHVIYLHLQAFELEDHATCSSDYVIIYDGDRKSSRMLGRFCGTYFPEVVGSSGSSLLIIFRSNEVTTRTGFKIQYSTRKRGTINEKSGRQAYCSKIQDCPSSCTCSLLNEGATRHLIIEGQTLRAVPGRLPSDTEALMFHHSRISSIDAYAFSGLQKLLYIDLCHNCLMRITENAFFNASTVRTLRLNSNFLKELKPDTFKGLLSLQTLDLGKNLLDTIERESFEDLRSISILSLRSNRVHKLDPDAFENNTNLTQLYLQHNLVEKIPHGFFGHLKELKVLYLNDNKLKKLTRETFKGLISLDTLYLQKNTLTEVDADTFKDLKKLKHLKLDRFIHCCYAIKTISSVECESPKDAFSSCDDLMKNKALQVFIWLLGLLALTGNFTVIVWRSKLRVRDSARVNSLLLRNLAVADLLMGVYLLIVASKDVLWRGQYFRHDEQWRASRTCEILGMLSLISSEVSVLTLAVVTADRFVSIVFSMRFRKLSPRNVYVLIALVWIIPITMAAIPLLGPESYFYDKEASAGFYGHSGVCLPLQLSQERFAGWEYSAGIFLALNLAAFLFILLSYLGIFWKARSSSLAVRSSTQVGYESALARRLIFIILTDFSCWMPVILIGVLSLLGKFDDPGKQAYAWIAVFVLPVNSSINPILYTFSTRDWKMRSIIRNASAHSLSTFKDRFCRNFRIRGLSNKGYNNSHENVLEMKTLRIAPPDNRTIQENTTDIQTPAAHAPHLRLKFLEVAKIFPGETSSSVGFVMSTLESPHSHSRCLVKYFGNNKRTEWGKEKDVITLLLKEGGHPNVLRSCWNSAANTVHIDCKDAQLTSLKGSTLFICYEFSSSVTLEVFLEDSRKELTSATLLAIATDVINAIAHLERCGVSHNAVVPCNILIAKCLKIPPIRAVLGGFAAASIFEQRTSSNRRDSEDDDLVQYGSLLQTMLRQSNQCSELEKVLHISQICHKPNVTPVKIRELLDEVWDSKDVWEAS